MQISYTFIWCNIQYLFGAIFSISFMFCLSFIFLLDYAPYTYCNSEISWGILEKQTDINWWGISLWLCDLIPAIQVNVRTAWTGNKFVMYSANENQAVASAGHCQRWTCRSVPTRTADGRSVSAGSTVSYSARQRDPPLPGNGGLARRTTAPVQSRSRPDAAKAFATDSISFKVNLIRYTADDGSRAEPQPILQVIVLDVITVTWMVLIASIWRVLYCI